MVSEAPPLTNFDISHGVCDRCLARIEKEEDQEPLIAEYGPAIDLYRELFQAARDGNAQTCAAVAARALSAGFRRADVLVGIMQPALAEIGSRWERGEVTVADEHRFTAWCEAMHDYLGRTELSDGPLDILLVPAFGNRHVVGLRIAEHVLRDRGIRALALVSEPSLDALVEVVQARAPRWVGFSCALPEMIPRAQATGAVLRDRGFRGGILVSGQAVRRGAAVWPGARSCGTVEEAWRVVTGEERGSDGSEEAAG